DLLRSVDLAGAQPLEQVFDGEVEVHDLVGLLEEAVGHGLADGHAGRALDQVVQALEVLHVEGGDDVDARGEELEHVLPALAVARAREVRVRSLVDDGHLRAPREDRAAVHLLDGDAAVLDAPARHDLEPLDERRGLGAAVGLDEADDAVDAALAQRVRLLEHAVGLADAGGEAEIHLQPAALRAADELEEVLGARRHPPILPTTPRLSDNRAQCARTKPRRRRPCAPAWSSRRWVWSSATSAPARSTPCPSAWRASTASRPSRPTSSASSR